MPKHLEPAEPIIATDEIVTSVMPALQWARLLQLAKQHGIMTALVVAMAWQIGILANAQQYMCGV